MQKRKRRENCNTATLATLSGTLSYPQLLQLRYSQAHSGSLATPLSILSPATTIHRHSSFATSCVMGLPRNWKMHQHKVLRLPRENDALTHVTKPKTQQKHAICEKINLEHVILITLCERRPMVRLIDLIANTLRTVANMAANGFGRASNAGRTRLQPPDRQS